MSFKSQKDYTCLNYDFANLKLSNFIKKAVVDLSLLDLKFLLSQKQPPSRNAPC